MVLNVSDLKKGFLSPEGDRLEVIDLPALSLAEGEQVALQGSSGCGKTTLLHLIAGILSADSGRVEVAGTDLTRLSEAERDRVRARSIGYIFQTFNLLQGFSALENVELAMLFGSRPDRARARLLLEQVGLGHRLHYPPARLSVGQQQRVAVARAMANRPRLVLADEPTANLDPKHAGEALALIRSTCREVGAALLLVSHDPVVVESFERVEPLARLNRAVGAA
ncbi:MAG: ABC transporter ATP-binding protein [Candidatus Eremiobacterota bacterium]